MSLVSFPDPPLAVLKGGLWTRLEWAKPRSWSSILNDSFVQTPSACVQLLQYLRTNSSFTSKKLFENGSLIVASTVSRADQHRGARATLLQAVYQRWQVRQQPSITSLAGNKNTLAYYKQSQSYVQMQHTLSNIHGFYECSYTYLGTCRSSQAVSHTRLVISMIFLVAKKQQQKQTNKQTNKQIIFGVKKTHNYKNSSLLQAQGGLHPQPPFVG